ncbi:MAG: WD40/YVTN/BNR-like repeat-containing protein, partial [Candidatus Aminicenantaceae bacterium]
MMSRSTTALLSVVVLTLVLVSSSPALAQTAAGETEEFLQYYKWRQIGPANPGGRITDVEGVESNPSIVYVGAATGGLWKTVNAGITWEPIFDDQPNGSIGDLAVSLSDPDILYVGTGEPNNRNSSPWGSGVFKSTDAGETWEFVGLKDTHHIGRILIDPKDPDIVYVAALGRLWAVNEERGLFKTVDGGRTWTKALYLDEKTGVTDVAMDPEDSGILYAVAHERLRDRFDAGDPVNQWGPKAGIYITKDAGATWTRASQGLPTDELGRSAVSTSRSRPGTVYAQVSTKKTQGRPGPPKAKDGNPDPNLGGIFRSTDYGATWQHMNTFNNRPSYYSQIRVDPNDADVIWTCGSPLGYSNDGGTTVKSGPVVQGRTHIDYHAIWIDPNNSDHVIVGGDGGINITFDRGDNWEVITSICLAQYYAITADMRKPYYVYGGLQDNGNWGGPSRSRRNSGIVNADWFPLSNADGFVNLVDPTDFNTVYFETQSGMLQRLDLRTGETTFLRPQPPRPQEGQPRERYRFDWNAPVIISPHNPHTLYFGGNKLFKSVDKGDNWQTISPDLTVDPESKYSA